LLLTPLRQHCLLRGDAGVLPPDAACYGTMLPSLLAPRLAFLAGRAGCSSSTRMQDAFLMRFVWQPRKVGHASVGRLPISFVELPLALLRCVTHSMPSAAADFPCLAAVGRTRCMVGWRGHSGVPGRQTPAA